MKKRILSILLAGMLLASAAGSAFAVTDGDSEVWSAPRSGFEIRIPEAYHDAKTYITFADSGEGVNPGCGIVSASATCVMMPEAEYKALQAMMEEAYEKDDIDKLFEILEETGNLEWNLFMIYGIDRGRGEEELRSFMIEQNLNPDYFEGSEDLLAAAAAMYENIVFRKIGEKDGLSYYLAEYDIDDLISMLDAESIDPVYLEEYRELRRLNEQMADYVTLTGSAVLADAARPGTKLTFVTTDLEGNPVSSEEIFSGHTITMINMWATWCDPCKRELPALAGMAEDFEKQGCQIIGICLDAEDEETMADARKILEEAGVDYLNIVPFEEREELLPNSVYPTTYFVDENGIVLDGMVSGAMESMYPQILAKLLLNNPAGFADDAGMSETTAAVEHGTLFSEEEDKD